MEVLKNGMRYVQVRESELAAAYGMATREDPVTAAAVRQYKLLISSQSLKIDTSDLAAPAAAAHICENYYTFFSDSMLLHFFAFGFCPVLHATVKYDLGFDALWIETHGESRLASGRVDPSEPFGMSYKVPVVPAFGTYNVFVTKSVAMQTRVLIEAKKTTVDFAAPAQRSEDSPEIQVMYFDDDLLPDVETGRLKSRVATLLDGFQSLKKAQALKDACDVARANPLAYLQFCKMDNSTAAVLGMSSTQEDYAGEISGGADSRKETYSVPRTDAIGAAISHSAEIAAVTARGGGTAGVPNPFVVQFPLVVATPQPPQPAPPSDLADLRANHVASVAAVFRIPPSLLGFGANPTEPSYEERLDYVTAVENVQASVLKLLGCTFAQLTPGARVLTRFSMKSPRTLVGHSPQVTPENKIKKIEVEAKIALEKKKAKREEALEKKEVAEKKAKEKAEKKEKEEEKAEKKEKEEEKAKEKKEEKAKEKKEEEKEEAKEKKEEEKEKKEEEKKEEKEEEARKKKEEEEEDARKKKEEEEEEKEEEEEEEKKKKGEGKKRKRKEGKSARLKKKSKQEREAGKKDEGGGKNEGGE
jgi:hypothetical protein